MARVPLAWKNLTHEPRKLLVAIAGISFAVMLMFQQRGFNNALFDSTVALLRQIDADIVILHRRRFTIGAPTRFERDVLDIAASVPGVAATDPLYMENAAAMLRRDGRKARPNRVIGFNPLRPLLLDHRGRPIPPRNIMRPASAIIDELSKEQYGFDLAPAPSRMQVGELAQKRIRIVGTFRLGRDFATDGSLIMSDLNIAHYFPYRRFGDPLAIVDLGLVQCRPQADPRQVKEQIVRAVEGRPVEVHLRKELINREITFWSRSTPIGMIFMIGAVMGFAVGVITCYQVLATDVADHLSELATLKAMGYGKRYFFQLMIVQAVYLSLLGFVPGFVLSLALFRLTTSFTGLVMILTLPRVLLILGLTVAMCVVSGVLALRKLLSADPASLF